MTETQTLPVSRDEVFKLASFILQQETRVPSLVSIRESFETPASPAIAVYFSEWKAVNADKIAQIKRTPAQMRDYAMRLQNEIAEISARYKALEEDYRDLTNWLLHNYPHALAQRGRELLEAE